jgi:hypothetical protein
MNTELIIPAIRAIVESVREGHIFDSHFVIDVLIKEHSDDYLRFAASFRGDNLLTNVVHGHIAKLIPVCGVRLEAHGSAWSEHIHGKAGSCECWKRL